MEPLEGVGDEPERGWVDPDDRLWRHPSEIGAALAATASPAPPMAAAKPARNPNAWAVAGLAGMIGALLTAGMIAAIGGLPTRTLPVRSVEHVASGYTVSDRLTNTNDVVNVAQKLRPSVVEIVAEAANGTTASGSGVVFRDDGHILTNCHVVEGASNVRVVNASGKIMTAKVIGHDSDTDIAVLKVNEPMPAATLGSVSNAQVGQQAIAIGSPLGLAGGPSVTVGVISALGRPFDTVDGPLLLDMIQTDRPVAAGSSGGALVDSVGNVIGITTSMGASAVAAEGIGFATPIDIARDVAEQLVTTGRVVHIWLGVQGEDLDAAMAKTLGVAGGALVRKVSAGSPADLAGIKARDIITTVNGKAVSSISQVVISVRSRKVGDTVKLKVWRAAKTRVMTVKLAAR